MTQSEFLSEFKRLPPAKQRALYRAMRRIIEKPPRKSTKRAVDYQPGKFKPAKDSSLFRVLGALREEGKPAPSDEDVDQMLTDYLAEKHA